MVRFKRGWFLIFGVWISVLFFTVGSMLSVARVIEGRNGTSTLAPDLSSVELNTTIPYSSGIPVTTSTLPLCGEFTGAVKETCEKILAKYPGKYSVVEHHTEGWWATHLKIERGGLYLLDNLTLRDSIKIDVKEGEEVAIVGVARDDDEKKTVLRFSRLIYSTS